VASLDLAGERAEHPPRRGAPRRLLTHPTRLIGRAAELASLVELLQHTETRLITITGPGGCGKTRLAAEVASLAATHFAGGAVLVELAPLRDASRFTSAIADALDIQDVGARPLLDSVLSTLATLDLLMVLDNFEHILAAAPIVATLLETCPRLTVLATSREPLHLRWEQRFPLAPLALASADEAADPRRLERVPACSLFLERARAVNPTLVISPSDAPAIAEICARLDGLPLAMELAAARTNILSPRALLSRLQPRLDLRSTEVDRVARHRGLRETLDWSYELLSREDQLLFRRIGVFAGSASLEAIAAVCLDSADDNRILDQLGTLVDKALLQMRDSDPTEPRFEMLEIIREYAWEQLESSAELAEMRRRHAQHYSEKMRRLDDDFWGPRMLALADELERDLPNLRAALIWSLESDADIAIGLNIVSYPCVVWDFRGHLGEARDWLDRLLSRVTEATPRPAVARGLAAAAYNALMCGDANACARLVQDAVPLARSVRDPGTLWLALAALGHVLRHHEGAPGEPYLREGYAVAKVAGYRAGLVGSPFLIADCRRAAGDLDGARQLFEECLETCRRLRAPYGEPWAERGLGHLDWMAGAYAQAEAHLTHALRLDLDMRFARSMADVLEGLGWNAASAGQVDRAARFLGAAQRARESLGIGIQPAHVAPHQVAIETCRTRLGAAAFAALFEVGHAASPEQAFEWTEHAPAVEGSPRLTARELEVVRLLAQDYSNREIARALVIAERTAETHVTNILNKLNFTSRVQVREWAVAQKLVPAP